jgi:hypothetical protein
MKKIVKDRIFAITLSFIVIMSVAIVGMIVLKSMNGISTFSNACHVYGGNFYELQNASCELGHENCIYRCDLNGESFSMDDLDTWWMGYNQQICIKDCEYENGANPKARCVC